MEKFQILLKNERLRFYDLFAYFILVLNAIAFLLLFISPNNKFIKYFSFITSVIIIALIVIQWYILTKNIRLKYLNIFIIAILIAVISWIILNKWLFAVALLLLGILYAIAKTEMAISFYTEKIIFPSFPNRKIEWHELSNVVLKDGLLTLDFKNNKLFQKEVMAEKDKTEINEDEFNQFCQNQLIKFSKNVHKIN